MPISHPHHPIIYIRGFAATMDEIEETTATPYMGFNLGATKIRQRHDGEIVRFIFESPLLRLIKDDGYCDTFKDGSEIGPDDPIDPKCVWIFRYYEQASEDLGTGRRQTIPEIARDLRRLILRLRRNVCGDGQEERKKFRVHLVAHSMGGLIARCYLQNLCVHGTGNADLDRELELEDRPKNDRGHIDDAVHMVDKVFTYATPHNGIDLLGFNVPDLGRLDPFHVRNFNREVIHDYLKLPGRYRDGVDVNSLNDAFPVERFFCLVGTNHNDYGAFFKLSRKAAGAMSDGLVMIENATVKDAPRAFVHRSHSGPFGIVNSEEGYQNLRRFLFGDVRVEALLFGDEITLPKPVQALKDEGKKIRASYHIDTTARVRGAMYYLHQRQFDQGSAVFADYDRLVKEGRPVFLFSGYLLKAAKTEGARDTALAFAVRLAIRVPMYEVDNRFWFDTHFEGGFLFDETITFHVRPKTDGITLRYGLASRQGVGEAPTAAPGVATPSGAMQFDIPLGFAESMRNPPRPGFRGRMRLLVAPWNT